jgi:hypothetical protein
MLGEHILFTDNIKKSSQYSIFLERNLNHNLPDSKLKTMCCEEANRDQCEEALNVSLTPIRSMI